MLRMLQSGDAPRLAEPDVHGNACGCDMGIHPLENLAAVFVLVEAEVKKRAYIAAALGGAMHQRMLDRAIERVLRTAGVVQERHEIARGGKTEAEHQRILALVDQLVDVVGVESAQLADMKLLGVGGGRAG